MGFNVSINEDIATCCCDNICRVSLTSISNVLRKTGRSCSPVCEFIRHVDDDWSAAPTWLDLSTQGGFPSNARQSSATTTSHCLGVTSIYRLKQRKVHFPNWQQERRNYPPAHWPFPMWQWADTYCAHVTQIIPSETTFWSVHTGQNSIICTLPPQISL